MRFFQVRVYAGSIIAGRHVAWIEKIQRLDMPIQPTTVLLRNMMFFTQMTTDSFTADLQRIAAVVTCTDKDALRLIDQQAERP